MVVESGATLVTGGLGCIGAWTVRALATDGNRVVAFDAARDSTRLRRIVSDELLDRVRVVEGDITSLDGVEGVISDHGVDRIIHLAALQVPYCRADPPLGARVNVVGTVNVFEAARRMGIPSVVYTSSIAVFNQPGGTVTSQTVALPASHYGAYKLANEGTARAYWSDFGVPSIGLRPLTVYGPGRDRGLTSSPTRAMLAASMGWRYEIGFGGSTLLQRAGDVGVALAQASQTSVEGAHVVNLAGERSSMTDLIAIVRDVAGTAAGDLTAIPDALPFPDDVDTAGLEIVGHLTVTPLTEGVSETVRFFRDLDERGVLDPEEHGLVVVDGTAVDRETVR